MWAAYRNCRSTSKRGWEIRTASAAAIPRYPQGIWNILPYWLTYGSSIYVAKLQPYTRTDRGQQMTSSHKDLNLSHLVQWLSRPRQKDPTQNKSLITYNYDCWLFFSSRRSSNLSNFLWVWMFWYLWYESIRFHLAFDILLTQGMGVCLDFW